MSLEQLTTEQTILESHHILSMIQDCIRHAIEELHMGMKHKHILDDIEHAYLVLNVVEQIENKKFPNTTQILGHYKQRLYEHRKEENKGGIK